MDVTKYYRILALGLFVCVDQWKCVLNFSFYCNRYWGLRRSCVTRLKYPENVQPEAFAAVFDFNGAPRLL